MDDDTSRFEPRLGRIRDRGDSRNRARLPRRRWAPGRRSDAGRRAAGRLSRLGRGQDAATALRLGIGPGRADRGGLRRVIIKARIVRLASNSLAADAHLRYLARDGVTGEGERGRLYGPVEDDADGQAFSQRGRDDRHQFRFIVAPEDGQELADLKSVTRDLMRRVEHDLGSRLDWVAVDHFNTDHPHTHIVVRGRDDRGGDLLIAQDYITEGMRFRAQQRVSLELGPETQRELQAKLRAEISAERLTRIDRAMLQEAELNVLDLGCRQRSPFDQQLRIGRLKTLERFGLAVPGGPGVWTLSTDMAPRLRALGERGDIIKQMNRALARTGDTRAPDSFVFDVADSNPSVGKVIDKQLTGDLEDRVALIVDGLDGRLRRVEVSVEAAEEAPRGAVVSIGPVRPPADRTIAEIAEGSGLYRPSEHLRLLESGELARPEGAAAQDIVASHVRRLEALRRSGLAERLDADTWMVSAGFVEKAAQVEPRSAVRVLSRQDLAAQVGSDGATWLDRQLVAREPATLGSHGFGAEVGKALAARRAVLVAQGHAMLMESGEVRPRRNLLAALQRQELDRVGGELARANALAFRHAEPGETLRGRFTDKVQLASGAFAVVEHGREFTLLPWRPVIEPFRGRDVVATIEMAGGVSWSLGRGRDLGL